MPCGPSGFRLIPGGAEISGGPLLTFKDIVNASPVSINFDNADDTSDSNKSNQLHSSDVFDRRDIFHVFDKSHLAFLHPLTVGSGLDRRTPSAP